MKDLIVVSYATHRAGMLDEYEDQLAAAGIDFYLHNVTLADGINSVTARWKFAYILEMCDKFADYERIIFTDAWDVLFYGTKEQLLSKIPFNVLISAERNCWPETHLEDRFHSSSPWKFANAGMMSGSPEAFYDFLSKALHLPGNLNKIEQAWFNWRLADEDFSFFNILVGLDEQTKLFYTVSADKEDRSLRRDEFGIYNDYWKSQPQLFHFSGRTSSKSFRELLRGVRISLCSASV